MLRRLALLVLLAAAAAPVARAQPYASSEDASPDRRGLMQAVGAALGGETKLTAGAAGAWFGYAVSVSGDRALVGANREGAAYVFAYDGTTWIQQARLTGSGAGGDFGSAVAIDGDRAVVGARIEGAAYVFAFVGGAWVEQARLVPSVPSDPDFGAAVALSGGRALVGAAEELGGLPCGTVRGSAYVYAYNGTAWTEQARLLAADGAPGDCFGSAVALDGERALVGAYGDDTVRGSAYVFDYTGFTWAQRAKLTASDAEPGERFGVAVDLDGDRALIGADEGIGGGDAGGVAYVFAYNGTTWTERQRLEASDRPPLFLDRRDDRFGCAVALDGDRALIGAQYGIYNGDRNDQRGAAYRFAFDGTTWTETERFMASDAARDDRFGAAVALDREVELVGAYWNDALGANSGAAYVYGIPEDGLTYTLSVVPDTAAVGGTVAVTVRVTNGSSGTLTNVRPDGPMQATSGDGGAVVLLTGPTPPAIPSLAPGAADSLRYTFAAAEPGHVTFEVGVVATDEGGQAVEGTNPCPDCAVLTILAPIVVTAPAEDEIVEPGEPYTVRFEAEGVARVDLYLVERALNPGNGERVLVAEDVPAAGGFYEWDVPEDLLSPSTFLVAVDADDPASEGVSERFRVRIPWRLHRVVGTLQRPEYDEIALRFHAWSFNQDGENLWPEAYWRQRYHYYTNTEIGYDRFIEPVPDVRYDQEWFGVHAHTASDHPSWPSYVWAFGMEGTYASDEPWTYGGLLMHQPNVEAVGSWDFATRLSGGYGGVCYGLSMAMMAAFQDPERFDAAWLPGGGSEQLADVPLTDEVRDAAHALFLYQVGRRQRNEDVLNHAVTPRETLERLRLMFERDDRDRDRFIIFRGLQDGEYAAHAVVPLGMERTGDGLYTVGVFDPNLGGGGGLAGALVVDSTANSWDYPLLSWAGDTGEGLWLSIEVLHAFAPAESAWPVVFGDPPLAARGGGPEALSVGIVGRGGAVTSDAGELRYEGGVLTETLPDGFVHFPYTGRPSAPGAYVVPAGEAYRAEALPRADSTAVVRVEGGSVTATFTQSATTDSTRAVVDLLNDGLEVVSGGSGVFELVAVTAAAGPAELRTVRAGGLTLAGPAGLALTAAPDAATFRLAAPGDAGTYDLTVGRAAPGERRAFTHADVPLAAGAVHTIRPDWGALTGGTVTVDVDLDGDGDTDETLVLVDQGGTVSNEPGGPDDLPTAFALHAAYPNPFADRTTLRYDLPEAGPVRLTVYDLLGRRVAVLVDAEAEAGRHAAVLDGRGLASGTYVARLVAGGEAFAQRVTLVR